MAKKNFTRGLNSLLGNQTDILEQPHFIEKSEPPTNKPEEISRSTHSGRKTNEVRATFIINENLLQKLKYIAYWERALIKDVINASIGATILEYESLNGEIKPIPKK